MWIRSHIHTLQLLSLLLTGGGFGGGGFKEIILRFGVANYCDNALRISSTPLPRYSFPGTDSGLEEFSWEVGVLSYEGLR